MGIEKLDKEKESINIFDVSVDRLTIMANVKDLDSFVELINSSVYISLWKSGQLAEGQIFREIFFSFDREKGRARNRREFRMEFNPKKIRLSEKEWLVSTLLPLLKDVGLSRLDVAFDCDVNLSKFIYVQKHHTKRTKIESRTGDLETIYLGTRTSDKMVRIYNKAVEMAERKKKILCKLENGLELNLNESLDDLAAELEEIEKTQRPVWWRLEFELKREAIAIDDSIFDNLVIKEPVVNSRTLPSIQDRAMVEYLMKHPNEWSELAKATRAKYRKILRELEDATDEDLTEAFKMELKKKKNDLVVQVAEWLGLKPNDLFVN